MMVDNAKLLENSLTVSEVFMQNEILHVHTSLPPSTVAFCFAQTIDIALEIDKIILLIYC